MKLPIHRYLTAREFTRALDPLHAFRGEYVGEGLLQQLEEARLVVPKLRLRWPDPVARRFWANAHEDYALTGDLEPDGERWDAAVALENALHRWGNHTVYGSSPHPFDDPAARFAQFLSRPDEVPFVPWNDMRVDVGNNHHTVLFSDGNYESYYSSWQLLVAAEVADMGVHFRTNLADEGTYRHVLRAFDEGRRPGSNARHNLMPVHALRGFKKHAEALDAFVWYEEESDRALAEILKNTGGGRFRLDEAQSQRFHQAREDAAMAACARFGVGLEDLIGACKFLSKQWNDWHRIGRPLIAGAYKDVLAIGVVMTRRVGHLSYGDIRDRIGRQGGWFEPILDVIWPDWSKEEKERAGRTLKGWIASYGDYPITAADIDAFVDFLGDQQLEAFFWRLRSFEDHVFRGNEFALQGMKSDVEGMAVVVEQTVRATGAKGDQLYELFKDVWREPSVRALLKRDDVSRLARQAALAQDWPSLKAAIQALRGESESGKIAADLVVAHRIRGGVHHGLPENDEAELEGFFMALMRAAALTFAESRRNNATLQKATA